MNTPQSHDRYLTTLLVMALAIPVAALAWSGVTTAGASLTNSNASGHGKVTIDAYNASGTFKTWLTGGNASGTNLTNTLLKYVAEADVAAEKTYVAHLDNNYSGYDIWEHPSDANSVQHCCAAIRYNLAEDPRLHNARECVRLAIQLKNSSPATAVRILANGLHLIQDYFAHGNAPGGGAGDPPHGIPTSIMVDTNGNGVADTPAGELCDELFWDNHNDSGGTIPWSQRVTNPYTASWWHKHGALSSSWRYNASWDLTIEAMQCFAIYGNVDSLDNAFARGTVINGPRETWIDLLTRN
jgi:hypothetical protein